MQIGNKLFWALLLDPSQRLSQPKPGTSVPTEAPATRPKPPASVTARPMLPYPAPALTNTAPSTTSAISGMTRATAMTLGSSPAATPSSSGVARGGSASTTANSRPRCGAGYTWCFGGGVWLQQSQPFPPERQRSTLAFSEKTTQAAAAAGHRPSKLTQIFGGFGVWMPLTLTGAQYVDVQCLEITRHSQCIALRNPLLPPAVTRQLPSMTTTPTASIPT